MARYVRRYKENIIIDKDIAKKLKDFDKMKKELEPILSELKDELKDTMYNLDKKTIISNGIGVKLVDSYVSSSIDKEKLKKLDKEMYERCLTSKIVDASVRFTYGE